MGTADSCPRWSFVGAADLFFPDYHSLLMLMPGTQPCLGGDGKTLMFVNINCDPSSVKETLCSLRFAAKVNQCETGAKGGARKHITELLTGTDSAVTEPTAKEVSCQN